MKLYRLLLLVSLAVGTAALAGPSAAGALTVTDTATLAHSFEGQGCGSVAGALVTLPPRARSPRFVAPDVGDELLSDEEGEIAVASISARAIFRSEGRLVAGFAAVGSNAVCEQPGNYPEGWATDEVDLQVRYTLRERTYVTTSAGGPALRRPRTLRLGAGEALTRLRWSSWDGRVVRGRGVARPRGARGRIFYPVAVRLSRPELCGSRYRYLSLQYRFTRQVPPGLRRVQRASFDRVCS